MKRLLAWSHLLVLAPLTTSAAPAATVHVWKRVEITFEARHLVARGDLPLPLERR